MADRKWKRRQYVKKNRREKETLAYLLALPQRNREAISGHFPCCTRLNTATNFRAPDLPMLLSH